MPQVARKDVVAQRQDKESKRARGAMSCAECRRLKLKCDKTVPCSSCKRRGCAQICPNGSLITGQGTRFVLADTEKLHQKIAQMSDRIRQLEDALAILQSTLTREPHPLLTRELLNIKSSLELHSAVDSEVIADSREEDVEDSYIDAFGTLAVRDDGAATFYGRSAGSESLLIGETPDTDSRAPQLKRNFSDRTDWHPRLPESITNLADSFPLSSSSVNPAINLDFLVNSFVPHWLEAQRLCELYLAQAPWFFGAVTEKQLREEVLPLWYPEAPRPGTSYGIANAAQNSSPPVTPTKGAHDLALLFMIFCFGAYTDISLPPAPDNPDSELYFQLTRAALTLEPVLERPPSVATVQTLSLMAIYQGMCSGENSIESTWALMGMATKLAQSIGLHRDCARWKLPPAEVQKRRALFWELFITDGWQSLATGRLATFALPFVDCELPYDPDETLTEDGHVEPSFPFWKARFGAECVSAVVQGTLTSRAPKYSLILDLDRRIRDMELPKYAQGPIPEGAGLAQTMSHFMPHNYRRLTLLYVHRCFFAHAISSSPVDPIKSQYAPSFLAGYRTACELVGGLKAQFSLFPEQIARFWVLWTHAFSASVMLSSVVTHSPLSKVAPAALLELRTACDLFEKAASYGGRAVKFLPILQRLQHKAHQTYVDTNSGLPQAIHNDIFAPRVEKKDELSIFSGQTHTVATKANAPIRPSRTPSSQTTASSSSASSTHESSPPPMNHATIPAFAMVHPSLVDELNTLDGHLKAQIRNAYYVNRDEFARTLLEKAEQMQQQPPPSLPHPLQPQPQHAYAAHPSQNISPVHASSGYHQAQMQEHNPGQNQSQTRNYIHTPGHAPSQNPTPTQYQVQNSHTAYSSLDNFSPAPPMYTDHIMRDPASNSTHHPVDNEYDMHPPPSSSSSSLQHWASLPQHQVSYPTHGNGYSIAHGQVALPTTQAQYYTPEAALRGIAADDYSLQETWTSFMYQVSSPRQFLEDR